MGYSAERVDAVEITFICDRCGVKAIARAAGGNRTMAEMQETAQLALLDGWISANAPDVSHDDLVFFHTRRCAIGYFRAFVADAYGLPDPDADSPEPVAGDSSDTLELGGEA